MDLAELLALCMQYRASDLHLSAGLPPMLRIDGELQQLAWPSLGADTLHGGIATVLDATQRRRFESMPEGDFAVSLTGIGRFRANVFRQQRGLAAAFRPIPARVPTLAELDAPAILADIAALPHGLVLVSGPTGSGKSTTLAALLDHINSHRGSHILTIEDPIEFVHESRRSLINQRELGRETHSLDEALKSALRADPDVIMVGELRDAATLRLALSAAETGHLVLGTLHSGSAARAVDRIIDLFATTEKDWVRTMLADSLRAVIAQVLLKRHDGEGRVAAHEVLLGTGAVRNLIRENRLAQLVSVQQSGQQQGMQTLDQSLLQLLRRGRVSAAEAQRWASNPALFAMGS
ncbi:type IV pilus twitching motility protein PilT [Neisseriaceae bacterium JH1-16]|nr:type IV pilus twitching motility protein PilT [Neisseriaceae bacterium JH1-16]